MPIPAGGIHAYDHEPFEGYTVHAKEPGLGFYIFLTVYTVLAFVIVAPLVSWSRKVEEEELEQKLEITDTTKNNQQQQDENGGENIGHTENVKDGKQNRNHEISNGRNVDCEQPSQGEPFRENSSPGGGQESIRRSSGYPQQNKIHTTATSASLPVLNTEICDGPTVGSHQQQQQRIQPNHHHNDDSDRRRRQYQSGANRQSSSSSSIASGRSNGLRSIILRELHQSYPDQDPEFLCRLGGGNTGGFGDGNENRQSQQQQHQQQQEQASRSELQRNSQVGKDKMNYTSTKQEQNGGSGSKAPTETSSGVPSAATTTKLQNQQRSSSSESVNSSGVVPDRRRLSKLVLDVNSRRWKSRRPIGRPDVIQNVIASETNSVVSGHRRSSAVGSFKNPAGVPGKEIDNNLPSNDKQDGDPRIIQHPPQSLSRRRLLQHPSQRGMSDVASSILSEQHHHLNQPSIQVDISQVKRDQRQQQILQLQQPQHHPAVLHRLQAFQRQQYQRNGGMIRGGGTSRSRRSVVSQSDRSVMSSIVDDISPDDAADANDPGRGNVFIEDDNLQYLQNVKYRNGQYKGFGVQAACLTSPLESLLKMALLNADKWNVLRGSIPLSIGASSESLFRLISAAFISQYLGTDSMVAFLLVGLFVRLTSEELSGAIVDALSSFVQASMYPTVPAAPQGSNDSTGMYMAGQYVQLACIMQLVLQVPLLIVWAVVMEPVVFWFTSSSTTASVAQEYTIIVIFAYLVQALSRTLTVIFHICGHEHFESVIDVAGSTIQVVVIACVVSLVDNATLTIVAYIQVLVTVSAAITKIVFPVLRGWMKPIRRGLMQNMALIQNRAGLPSLLRATFFLVCGAVLEYGQWELLTIFVRFLGPAEVATWVLLGAFWDFIEALTEGIGEAAANQVAFLLSLGHAELAKDLSYSSVYWACIQSLVVASALLMAGQYLAVMFSSDPTIQHLFNNSIPMICIANVAMSFSQINWSLIGAQGRFRLATLVIFFSRWFVTMPVAAISVFGFNLNLDAVSGSLVVGYSTSTSALLFILLRSDWVRLATIMQAMNAPQSMLEEYEDDKLKEKNDAVSPGLGELDLDDFEDSSDDSDGFGFGGPVDDEGED